MKSKGSISIYLAIVFLSIVLLVCTIAEAARVSAIQSKDKAITMMAADSVIAGYAKQVYDDYGILLVWNKDSLDETISKYIQANIKMADIEVSGNDFLMSDLQEVSVNKKVYATDNGGDAFVKQVSEYLKYAGLTSAIDKIMSNSKEVKEEDLTTNVAEDITDKSYDKLSSLVEEINSLVKVLSNINELSRLNKSVNELIEGKSEKWNKADKKVLKEVFKQLDKVKKYVLEKESNINKAINKIESYLEKKSNLLKKNGYEKSAKDYMDENLSVLKKIKDKIINMKEFEFASSISGNPNETKDAEKFIRLSMQFEELCRDLQVAKITQKDKENKSIFDSAKDFLDKGILSLVIKDTSNLSTASVNTSSLPSQTSKSKSLESSSLYDKAAVGVYSNLYFGNYLDSKKKNALKYGLEYLVAGKDSDKSNLSSVVTRLVAIRHVPNYACIMKDATKQSEISAIAASIAAVTGLPFLEPIAKVILTECWVLAESANDVKILLNGEKLSLVKTESNWKTSLRNLGGGNSKGDGSGFKYEVYLGLLITLTDRDDVVYRTMDLIQMNICKNYNKEFKMNKGLMSFKSTVSFESAPLFTAMPWTIGMLNESGSYKFEMECNNGY
ncbi:MAG: hypothetical protein J6W35_06225 [Eubacterium sp.]|nr:hypothetical protein [Eubacterium sp.]